jgi:hypothetical protein
LRQRSAQLSASPNGIKIGWFLSSISIMRFDHIGLRVEGIDSPSHSTGCRIRRSDLSRNIGIMQKLTMLEEHLPTCVPSRRSAGTQTSAPAADGGMDAGSAGREQATAALVAGDEFGCGAAGRRRHAGGVGR